LIIDIAFKNQKENVLIIDQSTENVD